MAPVSLPHGLSLDDTLGAAFVGMFLAIFISGMTALQVVKYFQTESDDKRWYKLSVGILWLLDISNTFFVVLTGYVYYVSNYGSVRFDLAWPLKATIWTVDVQVAFVHILYAVRIWKLGKGGLFGRAIAVVVVLVATGVVTYTIVGVAGMETFFDVHARPWVFYVSLAATTVLDLLLAVTLCFYVRSNAVYRNTTSVVSSLVRCTFANGLVTGLCSLLGLITFFALPTSLIWMSCVIVLAKLYATSYLALLGSRRRWREKLSVPNMDVFATDIWAAGRASFDPKTRPSWESHARQSSHLAPLVPRPAHAYMPSPV